MDRAFQPQPEDAGFGLDRTNSGAPRPSKRAPAGRSNAPLDAPMTTTVSPYTTQQQPLDAPRMQWPPAQSNHQSPAPQSQSPTSPVPQGGQHMEAFKNMVLQMASFFQQYPEAAMAPGNLEPLLSQMSVGMQQGNQQEMLSAQQTALGHNMQNYMNSQSNGFDRQFPQQQQQHHDMGNMQDAAIVEMSAPFAGRQHQHQPPKPHRRAYAESTTTTNNNSSNNMHFKPQHHNNQEVPFQQGQYSSNPIPYSQARDPRGPRQQNNMRQGSGGMHGGRARPSYVPMNNQEQTEPKIIALVEFKRQRMKRYESQVFVAPGQYVVVEGDRGLDCGFVIHCCVREIDGSFSKQESIDNVQVDVSRIKSESGRVVRLAREDDVKLLHGEIASSELMALKTCRELAARMNIDMEIVDCEYQFDRKKISFYFEAPHSVDFRELNTELFRIFGVRIWLENLNSKVKNVVPEGALSHADKLQYTKNGLRPPRRT